MTGSGSSDDDARELDPLADGYVRLALAIGRHDARFVDAYFGPPAWRKEAARREARPPGELLDEGRALLERTRAARPSQRRTFLEKQIVAVVVFLRRLSGETPSLAEETRLLYDIEVPVLRTEELEAERAALESLLPGRGDLYSRVRAFRDRFIVPADRLESVVASCHDIVRERTRARLALPPGEGLEIEFTPGHPWSAYHWYEGSFRSRIEINTDLTHELGYLLTILSHEGYPGHHVHSSLTEARCVRSRGWREFTISLLFSPQIVVSEGLAIVGDSVIMTPAERLAIVRDALAPLAGLEGLDFETYLGVTEAGKSLYRANAEAGRRFLEGEADQEEFVSFLIRYALNKEDFARRSIDFARTYRSYMFAYATGEDLVLKRIGQGADRAARYFELLGAPVTPSDLAA